jgi:dTDP-4-dehydrorhamnose reductase
MANAVSTLLLVRAAEEVGAQIVYVSTDLVFNGGQGRFKEDDLTLPVNHYGVTKLEGEMAVGDAAVPSAVVRTSIIYGPRMFPHLNSFSDKVIESLHAGAQVTAFTDQCRCPIPAWNLANVLLEIAERKLTGIFHAACPEPSTRYEFACKIADVFALNKSLIIPKTMDEVPAVALRPKTLVLDTSTTSTRLSTHLLGFEEGILDLKRRMGGQVPSVP